MTNIAIPDWGVIAGMLGFALTLAGIAGAIYSRIGKLEGTLSTKLNGQFKEVCEGTKKNTEDISNIKGDVKVLKEEVGTIRGDISSIKRKSLLK